MPPTVHSGDVDHRPLVIALPFQGLVTAPIATQDYPFLARIFGVIGLAGAIPIIYKATPLDGCSLSRRLIIPWCITWRVPTSRPPPGWQCRRTHHLLKSMAQAASRRRPEWADFRLYVGDIKLTRNRHFRLKEKAKADVFDHIEQFHNSRRRRLETCKPDY